MDKPNNPKCNDCAIIRNSLRCWNCKYKTQEWENEHMMSVLFVNEFDLFKPKIESEENICQ